MQIGTQAHMAGSSFSKRHYASALAASTVVALLSWAYFYQLWRGVIVSDAGEAAANGYYKWERSCNAYIKTEVPAAGWRIPNVYDLVSRGPQHTTTASAPVYTLAAKKDGQNMQQWAWHLTRSDFLLYQSEGFTASLDTTPPANGWTVAAFETGDGFSDGKGWRVANLRNNDILDGRKPPPQVVSSGTKVVSSGMKVVSAGSTTVKGIQRSPADSASEMVLEAFLHPGTALVLAFILAVAMCLLRQEVSPQTFVISYALFWEEREYWRVFTAAFSHVDVLHVFFNLSSTWNLRDVEKFTGTFHFLMLTLSLVVTTGAVKILIYLALVQWRGMASMRERASLGFSGVIFAYATYAAVAMHEYCPVGEAAGGLCFETHGIPIGGGGSFPVNMGPVVMLVVTQFIMPRASFIGHLSGIVVGYQTAWGLLPPTPVVAGMSVIFMIGHSKAWASKLPGYSLMLDGWAGGDTNRVGRARVMRAMFSAQICVAIVSLCLFTWSSALAELLALVVGYSALQAFKCCCWPDSESVEHRACLILLKAYGTLSGILLVGDLLSLGAIVGQARFVEFSGVTEGIRQLGVALLVFGAMVHGGVLAACVEAGVVFRDGQAFLSAIGLRRVVMKYSYDIGTGKVRFSSGAKSGGPFPGGGRVLGTVPASVEV